MYPSGFITLTDGSTIDYTLVQQRIVEIAGQRNLIKFVTNPHNAKKLRGLAQITRAPGGVPPPGLIPP